MVLGVAVLLQRLHILDFKFWSFFWKLWPLIIVIGGVRKILSKEVTSGVIVSVIGLILLISSLFTWNIFTYVWPLILIGIGISIIFSNSDEGSKGKFINNERLSDTVIFSERRYRLNSSNFTSAKADVVFSQYNLDLRDVKIGKSGANIKVNSVFSSVDILVPKGCRVITYGSDIFGSWESNIESRDIEDPILEISGSALFGSVRIKE